MVLFEYAVILVVIGAFLLKASYANLIIVLVSWLPLAILRIRDQFKKTPPPIDPRQKMVFKFPLEQKLATIAGCLGFILAARCILEIGPSRQQAMAWGAIGVFGLGLVVGVALLWKDAVSLTLSEKGLEYSRFKVGPIAWKDIRDVSSTTFGRSTIINLHLVDNDDYIARTKPRKRRGEAFAKRLGLSPFGFTTQFLGARTEDILSAISTYKQAFG